jgi:hypothetical protein
VCKKCADGKTTASTGATTDDACVDVFADGDECSIGSQCMSGSCKDSSCCSQQKDSPACTKCYAGDGSCAACKAGYALNTRDNGAEKQNPFVCVACRPGTMSVEGGNKGAWDTWVSDRYAFPPNTLCHGALNTGDLCEHRDQCQGEARCNKRCCKDGIKICAECDEHGFCLKCPKQTYMKEDGICATCPQRETGDREFAHADEGSTDIAACYFLKSIDDGEPCRFDQPKACKSEQCKINCCAETTETNGGCLKCESSTGGCVEW